MATFIDWFCKRRGITELKPQDLEGPTFKIIKVFHPDVIHLQYQMEECRKLLTDSVDNPILRNNVSKPLPLGGPPGGPPGQVTIQSDFFFNKDLEYLRYCSKGSRHSLSISKMKATYYLDVGLEQMTPDQMWIDEECNYDIAAMYDISHCVLEDSKIFLSKSDRPFLLLLQTFGGGFQSWRLDTAQMSLPLQLHFMYSGVLVAKSHIQSSFASFAYRFSDYVPFNSRAADPAY
nr:hypothetical protein CTI12_AA260430, mitochondrial [Tanacetum cinerariifolium]